MVVRRERLRLWAAAGIAAPLVLAAAFLALTLAERRFLEDVGWSPVRRTGVEWPSLLELSARGWVLQFALVCAALLGLAFALSLLAGGESTRDRAGAAALVVMSLAVGAMALPPDPPGSATTSWQGAAHDRIYPLIPICALVAAALFALDRTRPWRRRASAAFLAVACLALALMLVDAVAQLVRFVFFGALLLWVGYVSAAALRDLAPPGSTTRART
jgi:hypothetical protein